MRLILRKTPKIRCNRMLWDGEPGADGVGFPRMSEQEPDKQEPAFRHPPLWIHASEAGKWLLTRREAKRRAVLAILDRVPETPASQPASGPLTTPLSAPKAARRSRS
jgi:hypothetical protein